MEIHAVSAERLTFFGDAVVAIALTLLALELPVPEGSTNSEMWHSATSHRESYLAFMISFVVIAAHWRAHHRVFRYVTATNSRLTSYTMYWLLTLVITPSRPTSSVATEPSSPASSSTRPSSARPASCSS